MQNVQELQTALHETNAEIDSFTRAILRHVDEVVPVETLLAGYRRTIEDYMEILYKLRELDKQ